MKISLTSAILYGLLIMVVSRVGNIAELEFLLVGGGLLLTLANTSANTFLQGNASEANRGQTTSLYMLAMRGGLSLGNLLTGIALSFMSVRFAFSINGVLAILIQGSIFLQMFRTSFTREKN